MNNNTTRILHNLPVRATLRNRRKYEKGRFILRGMTYKLSTMLFAMSVHGKQHGGEFISPHKRRCFSFPPPMLPLRGSWGECTIRRIISRKVKCYNIRRGVLVTE